MWYISGQYFKRSDILHIQTETVRTKITHKKEKINKPYIN